eukprot:scaffold236799_cov18-Tisochrysis_lutea.AAC.1
MRTWPPLEGWPKAKKAWPKSRSAGRKGRAGVQHWRLHAGLQQLATESTKLGSWLLDQRGPGMPLLAPHSEQAYAARAAYAAPTSEHPSRAAVLQVQYAQQGGCPMSAARMELTCTSMCSKCGMPSSSSQLKLLGEARKLRSVALSSCPGAELPAMWWNAMWNDLKCGSRM